jgi:hypothetical protein
MKSVGSSGSESLPLMIRVMVWHFVIDIHKAMTTFILVCFVSARSDVMATFGVLLSSVFCNLIDMYVHNMIVHVDITPTKLKY